MTLIDWGTILIVGVGIVILGSVVGHKNVIFPGIEEERQPSRMSGSPHPHKDFNDLACKVQSDLEERMNTKVR